MFPTTHNVAENKIFQTPEENKCLIDVAKNLTTVDNTWAYSNVASLLQGKGNLDKNNTLLVYLKRKLLQILDKNNDLENAFKIPNTLTCSNISFERLKTSFYPVLEKMVDFKISSNTLADEIVFNTHIGSRRHLERSEIQKAQDWSDILSNILKNDFLEQPLVSALDFVNENNNENPKISLLCVFTNETGKEIMSADFNKLCCDEDIKMILPKTWNIVVAQNVLTISDENNQDITMCFRNPLKARFDYRYSNVFPRKKFKCKSSVDVSTNYKERFQNGRKKKLNSPFTKTTLKQIFEPFNCSKDKIVYNSPRQDKNKETRRNFFLLLKEPLLFNCIEQNTMKKILMYKAHSIENVAKDGSESNSYKTLEELLAKSIRYDGEPVYMVSEPLKLMTRLKKEEIRSLNAESYYKCKHNLITSAVYKKLLIYKKAQMLRNTQHEKQLFRTVQPKTMQINTINEIYEPPKATRSCLDLPKNFATSFMINDFDVSKHTLQKTIESQMLNEPFVTGHRCSNLTKNFSGSITRRSFDMQDLFGGRKSNFHSRMNITALKHVNVKKLVSSVFRHFFHFYSLLGGNLRSGTVITRSGSNYWLQVAGVAKDSCSLRLAGELFTTVAGKKIVLNIFDYIKFLIVFARTRRLIIAEVVKQMMVCEELSEPKFSKGKCKRCKTLKNQEMDSGEFYYEGNYSRTCQSLPNIQP